ncbi:hypothetical protein [Azospirillum sp. A39]|uniref:hypothetical protein n=1 Tax=Azospirillum sp. A39 TaxID=3462279 RepID=UPI004045DE3D
MSRTALPDLPDPASAGSLDPRPSLASLERRAEPFRETLVRLRPAGRFGQVRWSRRLERGVDFLRVQFRPLEGDGDGGAMPFARPAEFAAAADVVRVLVSTGDGTLSVDAAAIREESAVGGYLLAQAAAWAQAHYPDYERTGEPAGAGRRRRVADLATAWDRDAVEEVAPDTLVAELRAAQTRAAALEERLPAMSDERNLLRERIVHLTAGCVALAAAAVALFVHYGT